MNIWHDISSDRIKPEDFYACIEISQGSKNKYELDKETGLILLDRVLYTSTHYPMNYGFLPKTLSDDGDPLDVFVLCSQPISQLSLVRCFPIGVVMMKDRDEKDEKIIAIPFGDPQYNSYKDISQLPAHIFEELVHFLKVYKQLEHKKVLVEETGGREKAVEVIKECLQNYKETFNK
ncbi:MAG: inorganic diphosphatase [Christensenellales bacterium]|jgi:inorganic pyrophosphatase